MVVHVALFKWKSSVAESDINSAMADVAALKGKVAGVDDIRCGKNYSKWGEGFTHAVVVLARDQAALDAYRNHPDHVAVAKRIDNMEAASIGIDFQG